MMTTRQCRRFHKSSPHATHTHTASALCVFAEPQHRPEMEMKANVARVARTTVRGGKRCVRGVRTTQKFNPHHSGCGAHKNAFMRNGWNRKSVCAAERESSTSLCRCCVCLVRPSSSTGHNCVTQCASLRRNALLTGEPTEHSAPHTASTPQHTTVVKSGAKLVCECERFNITCVR